jgi:hypothetical protein
LQLCSSQFKYIVRMNNYKDSIDCSCLLSISGEPTSDNKIEIRLEFVLENGPADIWLRDQITKESEDNMWDQKWQI